MDWIGLVVRGRQPDHIRERRLPPKAGILRKAEFCIDGNTHELLPLGFHYRNDSWRDFRFSEVREPFGSLNQLLEFVESHF